MFKQDIKNQSGYTIIETMISVSLFLVVIMSGMGALLNANALHQKSQDMRSIMDNLSFIMEDMSRSLRTGYQYDCYPVGTPFEEILPSSFPARSCADGWAVIFWPAGASTSTARNESGYYLSADDVNGFGKIYKSNDGAQTWVQLTPDTVDVDQASSFSVLGAESPNASTPNSQQPLVIIRLVGTIKTKNITTPFSLQTAVSQRLLDI